MDLLGALVSAGSSLLGGYMNQQTSQQNMQNQMAMNQANIAEQTSINNQNIAEQNLFAQNGIQWKVADAQKAGINPLAALGANTTSFSNVVAPQGVAPQSSGGMGSGVAAAGQNIGRAMQAMQSPADKAVADYKTKMDLESMTLDNDLKRATLASHSALARQAGQPPGVATQEPEVGPDVAYSRTQDGGWAVMPSKFTQDRGYGTVGEVSSALRNRLTGFWDPAGGAPKGVPLQPGHYWSFNPISGTYYQKRSLPSAWSSGDWSDFW